MPPQGKAAGTVVPWVESAEEPDDSANRRRLLRLMIFVVFSVAASLAVYLWMRPPNRHLEPTPYDDLIGQLRKSMSEEDVLALFRSVSGSRGQVSAYNEVSADTSRRVVAYKIDFDEPLKVRLGGPTGGTVVEWCYMDHCHDNIE